MSKLCKNCQNQCDDSANFCTNCGGSDFLETPAPAAPEEVITTPAPAAPETVYEQPVAQQPVTQQPVTQQTATPRYDAQPVEAPKKKKLPGWALALIIVGAVLVVLFGGCFGCLGCAYCVGKNIDTDDVPPVDIFTFINGNTEGELIIENVYTKGEFNGSYYNNPWADIKYYLPAGYSNGSASDYSDYEDSVTDCGMIFISDNDMGYICVFIEEISDDYYLDEVNYLDEFLENFDGEAGWVVNRDFSSKYQCGHVYKTASCIYADGDNYAVESFYARAVDNRMVVVGVVGVSAEANQAMFKQIMNAD